MITTSEWIAASPLSNNYVTATDDVDGNIDLIACTSTSPTWNGVRYAPMVALSVFQIGNLVCNM